MITDKIGIPLLKAAITGLLLALFVAALFGVSQGVTLWRMFWLVLFGCILAPWLILILPKETFDSQRLKPQEATTSLKVSIDWNDGQASLFSELGITREQFVTWCIGVGQGKSLGENHWCGSQGEVAKANITFSGMS